MKLTEKDTRQIKRWVKALRSGEYIQTRDGFLTHNGRHCCLGVACELFIPKYKVDKYPANFVSDDEDVHTIPGQMPNDQRHAPQWLKDISADFDDKYGNSLNDLNDDSKWTFRDIANAIEVTYLNPSKETFIALTQKLASDYKTENVHWSLQNYDQFEDLPSWKA